MGKTPRKSMAEIRAEEFMRGYFAAMKILERAWSSKTRMTSVGPQGGEELWPVLEKMQVYSGLYDEDYKELHLSRIGYDFERLRVRVKLVGDHPHAGRPGFILDSEVFKNQNGLHQVWFLDEGKIDNAFAEEQHIERQSV